MPHSKTSPISKNLSFFKNLNAIQSIQYISDASFAKMQFARFKIKTYILETYLLY